LFIGEALPYLVPIGKGGGLGPSSGGNALVTIGLFLLSFISPGLGGNIVALVLLTLRRSRDYYFKLYGSETKS